jgi:hypothetical protein
MLLNLQGEKVIPLANLAITIFISGWILIGGAESWGKVFATVRWNVRFLFLRTADILIGTEQWFEESTGKNAIERLKKTDTLKILRPGTKEYDDSLDLFTRFARDMADKTYDLFKDEDPERPSKEAEAFTNAFRIQIRRSESSRAPIYEGLAPQLADDTTILDHLRKVYPGFDGYPAFDEHNPKNRYWLLQCARIYDAKLRIRDYPVHTLMALLRSGLGELILEMYWEKHKDLEDPQTREMKILTELKDYANISQQAQEKQILEELKERASTLDPDVFDGLRAQDRFDQFSDMLHYAFKALCDSVTYGDQSLRDKVMDFLEVAVTSPERPTWKDFTIHLDRLLDETGKDPERAESDRNIVQSIVYVLALRRLKENSSASLRFLRGLRSTVTDTTQEAMKHRYLRDAKGQPTTSILKLNMAYQKYYDLATELTGLFPNMAPLGKTDVYITLNNTIGLRQILREVDYYLRLTHGDVVIVDDIAQTHKNFARVLERNLRERLSWKDFLRVRVTTMTRERGRLARNRSAVIFSSSIPLDAKYLEKSAGTLIQLPSPLLNPASVFLLLDTCKRSETDLLFMSARQPLSKNYVRWSENCRILEEKAQNVDEQNTRVGNLYMHSIPMNPSFHQRWEEIQLYIRITYLSKRSACLHWLLKRREKRRDEALRQMHALGDLQREIHDVQNYLAAIGVPPIEYKADALLPTVDPNKVIIGDFLLEFFIRHAKEDASPSLSVEPPLARGLHASA